MFRHQCFRTHRSCRSGCRSRRRSPCCLPSRISLCLLSLACQSLSSAFPSAYQPSSPCMTYSRRIRWSPRQCRTSALDTTNRCDNSTARSMWTRASERHRETRHHPSENTPTNCTNLYSTTSGGHIPDLCRPDGLWSLPVLLFFPLFL